MTAVPTVRCYAPPPVREDEILRYAGVARARREDRALLDLCLAELLPRLTYRVVFTEIAVRRDGALPALGILPPLPALVSRRLSGATRAVVLAATVGMAPDRLCARYGTTSPSRALFCQAIGAERIEALCDAFCRELSAERAPLGVSVGQRFSPGYGDLPLERQRELFALLSPERHIGLCLNESLLMSPTKSVTAILPIAEGKGE